MKKKNIYLILAVISIVVLLVTLFLSDKSLDLESKEVTSLYKYLGEVDIYHCGGLSVYSDKAITKKDLNNENALCMAYYNLDERKIKSDTVKSDKVNKNDVKICRVGDNVTLATNNDEDVCNYKIINKDDLNKSYEKIYGESIKDYKKFYISSSNACFLEGDKYYCGTSEVFTYSIVPDATIYRLMDKAVKKLNGDIVIYDYFLKESSNKCYLSNNSNEEDKACTKALTKAKDVDVKFVTKYASIYKHTFRKDKNNNYYWVSSKLK